MSAESWLNRIWYDRPAPPWWLIPLSLAYGAVSGSHRFLYTKRLRRSIRLGRPVIVVGNLTVGGTGKTPLVCWLAARLAERGYRPGIVTRGYGGSLRGVRLVNSSDDPALVGDEPILLARRTGLPVAVGRDRPAAAQLLVDLGCDVVVSDDGLQHYALARDCEIVVIDGDRRFGNGWLLPAGPLREKRAVAGIGHPERFFNMLRAHGIEVIGHALPDHARLTPADVDFPDAKPVLMTEKDAVKCRHAADERHWYVPVSACFEGGESTTLLDIVIGRIAERGPPRETVDG
jgi:tetraacyldisaccharide 4'-kinase